ncbi:Hypothetical_protein [Hexamita inflata]|uniref:Hypothetical_protein n=1 Tax=Hexamita inflata TaxID=28002 RepID=A0AA86R3G6_9EUKA|nr:Hypothetical protein HINF_LOCUS56262 [Hexamita inflata]
METVVSFQSRRQFLISLTKPPLEFKFSVLSALTIPISLQTGNSDNRVVNTLHQSGDGRSAGREGLQLNCFKNVFSVIQIQITWPCLRSHLGIVHSRILQQFLLEVESMDFFIVYDNRDIDRFEKFKVGSELSLSNQPPLSSDQTIFNINIPKMNVKGISTWILYFEFHIYFKSAVPVIVRSFPTHFLLMHFRRQSSPFSRMRFILTSI